MGAKVSSGDKALSDTDLAYFTQNTGLQREQVVWNIFHPPIQNFHLLQVLNYYARFTRVGDPLKSPIDQTEFLEIMQVSSD